jgi:dihydrodipicolinate synthase/N-acetylneuraminate lyase
MGIDPDKLAPRIARLKEMADAAGKKCPDIVLIGTLADDQSEAIEQLAKCAELGATDYIQASRYNNEQEFDQIIVRLEDLKRQMV